FGAFFYNVIDQQGESYMLYTISGVPREAFSRFPMPRNTDVFAPTFNGSGTVRSADIRKDPRYGHNAPHFGMPAGHLPVVSYLAVPVLSRAGSVLGGLFFGHGEEGVFTENEEQIAEALAAQAAVAIDNARLYDALRREREQLARSEARYKSLVLATANERVIWVTSPDGTLIEGAEDWARLTGRSVEELTRRENRTEHVHPDDRDAVLAEWQRALETCTPLVRHFRLRVRGGMYRWFAMTAVPMFDEAGRVIEWIGSTVDVHDERFAQERMQFLAEASTLLGSSLDYETTLKTLAQLAVPAIADWCAVDIVNDEGGPHRRLAVAHKDPEKIELAHEVQRRFPPDPRLDTVSRVIRTGRSEWMAEISPDLIRNADLDHDYREMLLSLNIRSFITVPLKARDRVLGAVTFVFSDSGRRFTEADLAFAEELARRAAIAVDNARLYTAAQDANRAKDEFLATLSHELRTPMTAVLGWARMLKMGLEPNDVQEAVDAIERSATVQMDLIEDILDMSRIMAGKMRIETAPVDLRAVADAAIATVRPVAAAKNIEILTSYPADAPAVAGDGARLQQVAWNLVVNAVKFTPAGGTVIVRVASTSDTVVLAVRDTGIGIPRGFLPHVFEPFRQQDSSTTRAHGGIGLGLAIVRSLVELHGGRITAESEGEGHGATFTVELPAMEGVRGESQQTDAPGLDLPSLAHVSVLVIDDQAATRDVVGAILRRAGAQVTMAGSVTEAFALLETQRPDVIVSDIAMPVEDGYQFIRRLRHAGRRTPVIALTAFGGPEDERNARSAGFDAYLKKPVDPAALAITVREML
ncbi:MAG TPA: ATP-binding protein, partial [Thermoanaerobaculia bacterium]|nr:ATP-binding protein [Thermoanaerobaculia bacterium]